MNVPQKLQSPPFLSAEAPLEAPSFPSTVPKALHPHKTPTALIPWQSQPLLWTVPPPYIRAIPRLWPRLWTRPMQR